MTVLGDFKKSINEAARVPHHLRDFKRRLEKILPNFLKNNLDFNNQVKMLVLAAKDDEWKVRCEGWEYGEHGSEVPVRVLYFHRRVGGWVGDYTLEVHVIVENGPKRVVVSKIEEIY